MNKQKILVISVAVLAVLTVIIGYSIKYYGPTWNDHAEDVATLKVAMTDLLPKIKKALGDGSCVGDSECRLIGMGVKLCGNHERYALYSLRSANESELMKLIGIYNEAAEKLNKISYKVLDCGVKASPVACIQRACTPLID